MAAPPVPYRAQSNNRLSSTPSFPPPLYYRDTFGLEPVQEHLQIGAAEEDGFSVGGSDEDGSGTTKSTVRHTIRIFHPNASMPGPSLNKLFLFGQHRRKSGFSTAPATSNHATVNNNEGQSEMELSHSYQAEELLMTDQVLIVHSRPLLWISTISFGVALQLLIFSVVCLFFDGHWLGPVVSSLLLFHSTSLLIFVRVRHTRQLLLFCTILSLVSTLLSFLYFLAIAYLIHTEDLKLRKKGGFELAVAQPESNQIVQNARIAMYSVQMINMPIFLICAIATLYILWSNRLANREDKVHKGFFLTQPAGHQKVLVPIRLRQVRNVRMDENGGMDDDQQQMGAEEMMVFANIIGDGGDSPPPMTKATAAAGGGRREGNNIINSPAVAIQANNIAENGGRGGMDRKRKLWK